jgi:hypothetical protein
MVDFGSGMVFGRIVGGFGGSLDDGVKFEGRRYLDQRDVEYFGGHSRTLSASFTLIANC